MQFIFPIRWDNRIEAHENTIIKQIPKSGMVYRFERYADSLNYVQTNILVFFEPSSIDYATRNRVSSFFFNRCERVESVREDERGEGERGEKPRGKRLVILVLSFPMSN